MPTSVAAKAPKACEMAVRCGMAVIGIQMEIAAPMPEPRTRPNRIHWNSMIRASMSVPTTATSMPAAASCMPRRALSGRVKPRKPRMNSALAARYEIWMNSSRKPLPASVGWAAAGSAARMFSMSWKVIGIG